MKLLKPEMFPIGGTGPRQLAGYDLDANRILLPEHIRAMPFSEQVKWAKERGMQPTKETLELQEELRAQERKKILFGTFIDRARLILDAAKLHYPETQNVYAAYSMFEMMQPWGMTSDAPSVTAAAETILTQATILTLPGNHFSFPLKTIWLHAMGRQSNTTTPGTYTFRLRYGSGVVGDTLLVASGAIIPDPVTVTDNLWFLDLFIKCLAQGALATSLTLMCHGVVEFANADASLASDKAKYMPAGGTSLANVTGLDGNNPKTLTLTVQPTVATGSITCRDATVVSMN